MSSRCKIAIVGGGLGGLATANALKTCGIAAEVFEAAPVLGEIGASVNTSPQAVKALQAISETLDQANHSFSEALLRLPRAEDYEPLAEPLVSASDRKAFLMLARAGFGQPRKQLLNSLQQGLNQEARRTADWSRDEVRDLLKRANIEAERRPQELRLDEWRALFDAFQESGREPDS